MNQYFTFACMYFFKYQILQTLATAENSFAKGVHLSYQECKKLKVEQKSNIYT